MNSHTDSHIIEYNEDGSRTETSVVTYYPPTKTQKAAVWTGLVALTLAPLVPIASIVAIDKWEERRAAKKEAKKLKSVD